MATSDKKIYRLTERPQYLSVAATRRKWVTPAFILQVKSSNEDRIPRLGYTVSKKVGNAVMRNKAKRRLKETARDVFYENAARGWDYVLVGRQAAIDYPYKKLQSDLLWALAKLSSGADLKNVKTEHEHKNGRK